MRIADKFQELSENREGALIVYVMAGDPSLYLTKKIVNALEKGGADMIELGLPFSDPIADGPTIQAASERALNAGMNPDLYFNIIKEIREDTDIPLICLTYYNLVLHKGIGRFMRDCAESGINGIIIPDLPIEEARQAIIEANKNEVDFIPLIAPTSTEGRRGVIASAAHGFIYLVSLLGVTGARKELSVAVKDMVCKVRRAAEKKIPIAVGFGLSSPAHVQDVIRAGADGAIVGSALVNIIAQNKDDEEKMLREIREFVSQLKEATHI
ncbi:MAG: tryptophan synthase subunit alpha [Methanocellales archaeon]|nr:tryptophan synthase subunit alpha [Methanocellales archaeon]MDD3291040.1 tryptophan synthase subunit alpha [Methanocellales archaeon]MDD5234925.1 tryptophan synthase subunit alpha [Methanocellales archaeon]MDD5484705.1 tryptophan synthase subunit alpha [Methanocellales archaeon]